MVSAIANWRLEIPQHPETGMSALRRPADRKGEAKAGSAGFPACGFAELSSSALVSAVANWRLENPQHPQTGMSALRRPADPKVEVATGSAGFPARGVAELSSPAAVSAVANWGLERPQRPQAGMSAVRRGTGTGRHRPMARPIQERIAGLALRCLCCLLFSLCLASMAGRHIPHVRRSKRVS